MGFWLTLAIVLASLWALAAAIAWLSLRTGLIGEDASLHAPTKALAGSWKAAGVLLIALTAYALGRRPRATPDRATRRADLEGHAEAIDEARTDLEETRAVDAEERRNLIEDMMADVDEELADADAEATELRDAPANDDVDAATAAAREWAGEVGR